MMMTDREVVELAQTYVHELCEGKRRWSMPVPADPDRDVDLVISRALDIAKAAVQPPSTAPEVEVRDHIRSIIAGRHPELALTDVEERQVDALTRLIDDREQGLIKDLQDAQEHDAFLIEGLIDALGPASDDVIEQIEAEFEESRS